MWVQIAVWVVLAIVAASLRPKQPAAQPPSSLEDFNIPITKEGTEIAVLFGTRDIKSANVMWYGDLKTVPIKKKGGKK